MFILILGVFHSFWGLFRLVDFWGLFRLVSAVFMFLFVFSPLEPPKTTNRFLSKGLRPHAAGPLLFGGVVAKMRSGYVSVGHWLGLALGKHQGKTKKGSKVKL